MCLLSRCYLLPQVFFIRDGMKFPDMVHSLKPNPKSHIQVGSWPWPPSGHACRMPSPGGQLQPPTLNAACRAGHDSIIRSTALSASRHSPSRMAGASIAASDRPPIALHWPPDWQMCAIALPQENWRIAYLFGSASYC